MMPCKGCEKRYPACHDHCEDYQKVKKEGDRLRQMKRKDVQFQYDSMIADRNLKNTRRKK